MATFLIDSPADVQVSETSSSSGQKVKYGLWFRTGPLPDDMQAICFSGAPADLKAIFSEAVELIDRQLSGG